MEAHMLSRIKKRLKRFTRINVLYNIVKKRFKIKKVSNFIKLGSLSTSDKRMLAKMSLSLDYLLEIGQGNIPLERKHLSQLDESSRQISYDERIPAYQQTILETGYILSLCPICGKVVKSNQSFCISLHAHEQPIFYRFNCCQEFYLIDGRSIRARMGVYIPARKLVVSFIDYKAYPHDEIYYSKDVFDSWVSTFLSYVKRNKGKVEEYTSNGPKKTALLCCFTRNHNHHLFDEISALQFIIENNRLRKDIILLKGPCDSFDVSGIFPELGSNKTLSFDGSKQYLSSSIFNAVVENNLLATKVFFTGPLQEKVAQRIYYAAYDKCSEEFMSLVRESANGFPLIWITLRSHNRSWISQVEGIVNIIKEFHSEFPDCGVVFDGVKKEQKVLNDILQSLPSEIRYYDALSCKFHETIVWSKFITFFIAPRGNGCLFTTIANKPGILHTHTEWSHGPGKKPGEPYCVDRRENCVLAVPVKGDTIYEKNKDVFTYDYDLDWKIVYNEARKLLDKIIDGSWFKNLG